MDKLNSKRILQELKDLTNRFPLTVLFIVLHTIIQLRLSESEFFWDSSTPYIFLFGMFASGTAQLVFERFYQKRTTIRWLSYGLVIGLTILLYVFVNQTYDTVDRYWTIYSIPGIRIMILLFVLIISFIWAQTVKSKVKFSENFFVVFRSLFSSFFFSLLMYIGIIITIGLFQFLFFDLDTTWYINTGILIFYLLYPVLFFSSIPTHDELATEGAEQSKFLTLLITFVFIPIMAILSVIIVLYILMNITTDFFSESLIEGLTLSYTINGWVILLLADNLDHILAKWFRKLFPFGLIFVIILQMISTFLQIQEVGITHGRYFILLFGIGSIISAVWFIVKNQDFRLLPLVAVVSGLLALVPYVDAVGLSVRHQVNRVNDILEEYDMFVSENEIQPNEDVPEEDQEIVEESLRYLSSINGLNQLGWLPEQYYYQSSAYLGFGGSNIDQPYEPEILTNVQLETEISHFSISAFDTFHAFEIDASSSPIQDEGEDYTLDIQLDEEFIVNLTPADGTESIVFDFTAIFEKFEDTGQTYEPLEEMTFTVENEGIEMQIIVQLIEIHGDYRYIEFFLFI